MSEQFYTPVDWLEIIRPIAPEAFLTGSRAFGTAQDPKPLNSLDWTVSAALDVVAVNVSDTDIAVLVSNAGSVKTSLDAMFLLTKSEESGYNSGFKYKTVHGILNIVPLHPLDFVCWKLTTAHIRRIVDLCPDAKARIANRETKLGIFEALSGIHKMLIPYTGLDAAEEIAERIAP